MTTTTAKPEKDINLDERELALVELIETLRSEQQRLSLPALSDPAKATALGKVRADLEAAEQDLAQLDEARREHERLAAEAAEQGEEEARAAAIQEAEELTEELRREGAKIDAACDALVSLLPGFEELFRKRHEALVTAGQAQWGRGGSSRGLIAGALAWQLERQDARALFRFPESAFPAARPLADIEREV